MMIWNLPRDLTEEILSRLPMQSIRAVRLTCKTWDTLSKTQSFAKLHISKLGAREAQMVLLMEYYLCLIDANTDRLGKLTYLNDSGQVTKFSRVFHCDGLLLCNLKDDSTRFVVWNPYWGQTRWIRPRFSYSTPYGQEAFSYGFGYQKKKSGRRYKILRFTQDPHFSSFEIYDLSTDSWTSLVVRPRWRVTPFSRGVCLKGNTYWGATKKNSRLCTDHVTHIICFDFTRGRFGRLLPLPFRFNYDYDRIVTLSCVKDEKLAALFLQDRPPGETYELEIWITPKIEEVKSEITWSKILTVPAGWEANIPMELQYGNFFIDEVKKLALLVDQENGRYTAYMIGYSGWIRVVELGGCVDLGFPLMHSYVPSLVQVARRRKQQGKRTAKPTICGGKRHKI